MNVLFVDDDHGFLDQAKYVLETKWSDMEIKTADSARKALNILDNEKVDAIVSDYLMPEMDGIELLQEVRENHGDIPFILFTGKGREEVAMKALNMGANRYIRKGGDPTTQYEMLAQAIEQEIKHRKERERQEEKIRNYKRIESKFRNIFNNMGVAMVSLKEDMTITQINESFETFTSYRRKHVENKKNWLDFVREDEKDRIKKHHKLILIDPSLAPNSYTFHLKTKYSDEKFVCASFSCSEDGSSLISIIDLNSFETVLGELKKVEESLIGLRMGSPPESVPSFVKGIFDKNNLNRVVREWMLDEILLMLISLNNGASGKVLMNELNKYFGLDLSSSIVYPSLHRLEEKGFLTVKEGIKTKQYRIKDTDKVQEKIQSKLKEIYGAYVILKLMHQK